MHRSRFIAALLLLAAAPLFAQKAEPHLEVSTANHQTTFHIGERIPLILGFTGDKSLHINNASYDRGGRLGMDYYEVSPSSGWSDPLKDYFSAESIIMAGGLFNVETLEKPFTITRDLNEFIRFDQTGDYQIVVISHRVLHKGSSDSQNGRTLKSAPVTIHIIAATPEWQQAALARILQTLATREKPNQYGSTPRSEAKSDLRYLGSAQSLPVLASFIRDDETDLGSEAQFGLFGLPESMREAAVEAMKQQIDDPKFPVSYNYLWTLAKLQELSSGGLPAASENLSVRFTAEADLMNNFLQSAWQATASALPHKEGTALALTAHTLFDTKLAHPSEQQQAQVASVLAASFLNLPPDLQTDALQNGWETLHSPAMLATVKMLASSSSSWQQLRSITLQRWYEDDPAGATREILTQLGTTNPPFDLRDIWFFPTQPLPQFESLWASALEDEKSDTGRLGALLTRFGTGAAAPQVIAVLSKIVGHADCNAQSALIAYLIRFDPDAARPFLGKAIAAREEDMNSCWSLDFTGTGRIASGPVLVQAAIVALNDLNPEVVKNAADYLKDFGDASARQPLLNRYLQWSQSMSGKADKLDQPGFDSDDISNQRNLGRALGESLLANQGWLPDKTLIKTVVDRAVGKNLRLILADLNRDPDPGIMIMRTFGQAEYRIGPFHPGNRDLFEAKIAQFPEGTQFWFQTGFPQAPDMLKDTREILAKHHMKLPPENLPQTAANH